MPISIVCLLFLQQAPPSSIPAPGSAVYQYAYWVLLIFIAVVTSVIIIIAQRKQNIDGINKNTVQALRDAISARDVTIADLIKQNTELKSDLGEMTTEYTTIVGINMKEHMDFAEKGYQKELQILRADNIILREQNSILERRVRHLEGAGAT
jgi:hypothetical protein